MSDRNLHTILEFQKKCQQLIKEGKWSEVGKDELKQLRSDLTRLDDLFDSLTDFDGPEAQTLRQASGDEQELINEISDYTKQLRAGAPASFASSCLLPATANANELEDSSIATQNALLRPIHASSCSPSASYTDLPDGRHHEGNSDTVLYDKENDLIGSGPWGNVFSGVFGKRSVAVKVPKRRHKMSNSEIRSFKRWKDLVANAHGGQLVEFVHASTDPQEPMILTEAMRCNLEKVLHNSFAKPSVQEQMKIAYDVAIGMNWLHMIAIPHGGLKPRNVLMNSVGDWHLSDFGFSDFLFRNTSVFELAEEGDLSYKYLAPEFICQHMKPVDPSAKKSDDDLSSSTSSDTDSVDMFAADVYSFGVLLYEIVKLQQPFEQYKTLEEFYDNVVLKGARPEVFSTEREELDALLGIAQVCWSQDPSERPSFDAIVEAICKIMLDSAIPDSPARDFWFLHFCAGGGQTGTVSSMKTTVPWEEICQYLCPELTEADKAKLGEVLCVCDGFSNQKQMTMQRWYQCYLWFGCWFDADSMPMIAAMLDLFSRPWFHGSVSADVADQRLALRDCGYFLVRLSFDDYNYPFVLSLRRPVPQPRYIRKETRTFPIQRLAYDFDETQEPRFVIQYDTVDGQVLELSVKTIPEIVDTLLEQRVIETACPTSDDVAVPYSQFGDFGDPFSSSLDDIAPVK